MIKYIVTHGGGAHRDEFLAVSVAMALENRTLKVERREPTAAELDDEEVLVLDVGGRHEPQKGNFDHHQLERGTEDCALSLLLKHHGLHEAFGKVYQSYRTTVLVDSTGPINTAKIIGITKDQFMVTIDMVGSAVIAAWEKSSAHPMWEALMLAVGQNLLAYVRKVMADLDDIRRTKRVQERDGVVLMAIDGLYEPKAQYMAQMELGKPVGIIVSKDDRGAGYSLYRVDDHPKVDFSKLESDPQVTFAHKVGFIAKTKPMTVDQAIELAWKGLK